MIEIKVGGDGADVSFEERKRKLEQKRKEEEREEKKEKSSPYRNWLQLNREADIMKALIEMADHPAATKVWLFMMSYMDRQNALLVSQKTIAEALNISEHSVKRAIAYLKSRNIIRVVRSGSSYIYTVNAKVAWSSYGKNVHLALMNARVVLSEAETAGVQKSIHTEIKTKQKKN